ncbi:15-hydroxyprostaglandin dehydrogenase [NAD(+)] [Ixodes scapularis]|uniref:15-hydroxyprostaglandin dehydrogenase [NAD(+)] n=1 Tax=Ixodes scapularis TaxID=6945 RepID=UPI0011616A86|nr:15-hydroxyprostaglandin dehydrogenase [NAD(+)] [Ixodes scapularis]
MSENFEGKVALVTGGAMGLGKAITKLLLSEGCRVAVADMNQLAGEKTQQEFQAIYGADRIKFIICDVTDDEAFEDCFREVKKTFGRLDITVNNAGFAVESRWRKIFEINTMAVYFGTLLALKYMGKDHGGDGGFVINIASIAGLVVCPVIPAYNASKYGVIGLTRAFGTDFYYSRTGVRVSCLCPEPIETDLWRGISNFCQEIKVNSPYITENYGKQIQKAENVAKGVTKLIRDERNGAALLSLYDEGLVYHEFTTVR